MVPALKGAFIRATEKVSLDLSKYAYVSRPSEGILRCQRVLRSINTSAEPSTNIGFFTRNDDDFNRAKDSIDALTDRLSSAGKLPPGLLDIEIDNVSKMTNASGMLALSYFNSDVYPWDVPSKGKLYNDSSAIAVSAEFRRIAKEMGHTSGSLDAMNVDRFGYDGPACFYKKGSSYGLSPYVPGRSRLNSLCLAYHNLVAIQMARHLRSGALMTDGLVAEVLNEIDNSGFNFPESHMIMMISRARPMGLNKPMKRWLIDHINRRLTSTVEEAGFRAGTREIKAVPAHTNLLFSPYADLFSSVVHHIPGFEVGHQISSPILLRACHEAWESSGHNLSTHVEDISGYDNSVNEHHMHAFRLFMRHGFNASPATLNYLEYIDELPIATAGLFDTDYDRLTVLRRHCGIPSGFRGTTMQGTLINFILIVDALAHVKGLTAEAVIDRCANLRGSIEDGRSLSMLADWGVLLKGDDLIIFSKAGYVSWSEFAEARASQGIRTDVEPGPIFLMQYIDMNKKMLGRQYPFCPDKFKFLRTYASYGLVAKRLGQRLIFNEHPITDVRVARLAVNANIEDTALHPLASDFSRLILAHLNAYDPVKWRSHDDLRTYVHSDKGRADMLDYASDAGRYDPFLKEISRRLRPVDEVDVLDSTDSLSDFSGLPPWYDEILDRLGEFDLPALTDRYNLPGVLNAAMVGAGGFDVKLEPSAMKDVSEGKIKETCRAILKIIYGE